MREERLEGYCFEVVMKLCALGRIIHTPIGSECISDPEALDEVRSKCTQYVLAIQESSDEKVATEAATWLWEVLDRYEENKRVKYIKREVIRLDGYDFDAHCDDIPNGH